MASKRKTCLVIVIIVVSLFLLVSVFIGGLVIFLGSKIAKEASKQPPIKLQAWTDKSKNYKQTYKTKGLRVTINNVRKATVESGLAMPSDVSGPQIWIVVNLTVKNISNESKQSATIDLALPMKIVDVDGNEFTANGDLLSSEDRKQMGEPLLFEEIDKLVPGENKRLAPGQGVTGNIWFSVSEKSQGLKLQRFGELIPPFEEQLIWSLK